MHAHTTWRPKINFYITNYLYKWLIKVYSFKQRIKTLEHQQKKNYNKKKSFFNRI